MDTEAVCFFVWPFQGRLFLGLQLVWNYEVCVVTLNLRFHHNRCIPCFLQFINHSDLVFPLILSATNVFECSLVDVLKIPFRTEEILLFRCKFLHVLCAECQFLLLFVRIVIKVEPLLFWCRRSERVINHGKSYFSLFHSILLIFEFINFSFVICKMRCLLRREIHFEMVL